MNTKSRIAPSVPQAESPLRHLPLVDLLVDTKTELVELALRSGLKVFTAMLEEDRTAICGPRYAHEPDRPASRAGITRSEVVLGGRKVTIQRPRVRTAAGEVALPTFQTMAAIDPLERRVVEQMLVGVATRQYVRSLEPLGPEMKSRGTSKSAVSRRFVARTTAQLAAWQSTPLDALDLVALLIDGVHVGDHCLIVALGIAADGQKHALGLWDGSTENATVCQGLLANLQSRGLRTDRSLLVILDGSKALRKAVRATFGDAALVQRCQVHKTRNILEYLNDRQRPWAQAILRRAYQSADVKTAQRLLLDLARRLEPPKPTTSFWACRPLMTISYASTSGPTANTTCGSRAPCCLSRIRQTWSGWRVTCRNVRRFGRGRCASSETMAVLTGFACLCRWGPRRTCWWWVHRPFR
jgi:putative transposase